MENKELVMDLLDQLIDAMDGYSAESFKPKADGIAIKETTVEGGLPVEEEGDKGIEPEMSAVDMGTDEKSEDGLSETPIEEENPNEHRMLKRLKHRM